MKYGYRDLTGEKFNSKKNRTEWMRRKVMKL